YLDFVPKFKMSRTPQYLRSAQYTGKKNTVLALNGDSYTWHVADTNFAGVATLYYMNRSPVGGYYHIDTTRKNILVIEVAERFLRTNFGGLQIFDELHDTGVIKNGVTCLPNNKNRYASV